MFGLGLLLWGLIAACESPEPKAGEGPAAKKGRPAKPPLPVAVSAVRRGPISDFYESTATLEAERAAQVLTRVPGEVREIRVEEGDRVTAGQVLLRIEQAELALRVEQAAAKTAGLQDSFDRLEKMVDKRLVPVEELETTKHNLRSAKAEEGLARLELSRARVRAPFDGRIARRLTEVGQSLSANAPVFEIVDTTPLLARVHVPSKVLGRITREQPVRLELDSDGSALEGRIALVSPVIDPSTGTIKVTVRVDVYPEGTRPGDFAAVRIVTERKDDRLLVPLIALVEDKKDVVVYVVQDGRAQRRIVKVGLQQDDVVELLEGVEDGAKVVVKGQHALEDGRAVEVVES